jgi:hypothetical protein
MIRQTFGEESMSHAQVFEWHAQFRVSLAPIEDDQPTSSTMPDTVAKLSSFVRINFEPFKSLLMRSELVIEHANGF